MARRSSPPAWPPVQPAVSGWKPNLRFPNLFRRRHDSPMFSALDVDWTQLWYTIMACLGVYCLWLPLTCMTNSVWSILSRPIQALTTY